MSYKIISRWVDDGTGEGVWTSEVTVDYGSGLQSSGDLVNEQNVPPDPNIAIVGCLATPAVIDQIRQDPKYGAGAILTTPQNEARVPDLDDFDTLRGYLLELGMSAGQADDAIGTAPNSRTRWEISNALIDWKRNH